MPKLLTLASALFLVCPAFAQSPTSADIACRWSAELTVERPRVAGNVANNVADNVAVSVADSYRVPFDLLIERSPADLRAALLNGSDRIDFSSAIQQGSAITLRLDQYDATLTAHCSSALPSCDALEGEYVRQKGPKLSRYAFNAHCNRPSADSSQNSAPPTAPTAIVASDWLFSFTDSAGKPDSEPVAPAHFIQQGNHIEGTIAPVSGDYGLLSGDIAGGRDAPQTLSRFDGIHALRLDARATSRDRVEGVFHISPGHALNFVATRAPVATGFEEAEHLTSVEHPAEAFRFHGIDAAGATITERDPALRGKVVLIDIFGTWCPNCHDEAPVLQRLYAKYHARGLEIVGLSYEYVDDRARSLRLLGVYRRKYSIGFPLLLAGTTDEGQIAKTLPQLRNFAAYPTTIFLDRHGRPRLIHAGFTGPATGRMEELQQTFERTILQLLDEQQ